MSVTLEECCRVWVMYDIELHMVVGRALKRRQSKCQASVVHPREGNTFVAKVEKEVRKYDVDVSVKRELTWPEGAIGIPLMLAMVTNYIDMKQEMADRITHVWEYMCECLQIGRRETENAYVRKAFGGKVLRSKNCSMVAQSFTNTTRKEVSRYGTIVTGVKNGTRA